MLQAQLVLVDNNHEPIPFVQIVSNHRHFYAQSNLDGVLPWDEIQMLSDQDSLFFHHVSFETTFRLKGDLSGRDTIVMQQRIRELSEMVIADNGAEAKYEQMSTCFRSVQWNDDSTVFYTDGKADYLVKRGKDKYKIFKKEYRSMVDRESMESRKQRPIDMLFVVAGPFYPEMEYFPFQFIQNHGLEMFPVDSSTFDFVDPKGIMVARMELDASQIRWSINDVYSRRSRHALNTDVKTIMVEVTMIFRRDGEQDWLTAATTQNLMYIMVTREFQVKHDNEIRPTRVIGLSELFVESFWLTDEASQEDFEYKYGLPKVSDYKSEFWKNCDCPIYTAPNLQVISGMDER